MTLCVTSLVTFLFLFLAIAVNADCSPSTGLITIKSAQDVTSINSCTTFTGNIVVAADGPETIALDGVKSIAGNLDVENVANLKSLSSKSLQAVKSLTFKNLVKLSTLSLPAISNFSSIQWNNLPALTECTIATGAHDSDIQEITITNTALKSLDWITWPVAGILNISNNAQLTSFSLPFNSINIGSTLTFAGNAALSNISFAQINGIYGGVQISDNSVLKELSFGNLQTVGGFVNLNGDFSNISMPVLNAIPGALSVKSSGDISSLCNNLQQKPSSLKGHYDCTSNLQASNPSNTASPTNPSAMSTTTAALGPTLQAPKTSDNGLSGGGKAGIAIAIILLFLMLFAGAFVYLRNRSRSKVKEIEKKDIELSGSSAGSDRGSTAELDTPQFKLELAADHTPSELPARVLQEMPAGHGFSELSTPVSPATSFSSVYSNTPLVHREPCELPA